MAEDSTEGTEETAESATEQPETESRNELGDAGKKALAEERRARRVAERELEQLRKASMSDQEKAVAEAKQAGLTEAARATAPRLVRAELRAAAAEAGLGKDALAGFLEYADLSKFVSEDGEPDSKAITAAVKRLGGSTPTDFDGGARTSAAKPTDMNARIRQLAGLG